MTKKPSDAEAWEWDEGNERSYTGTASRRGMSMRFGLMALLGYLTSVIVQVTGR
jgi:hypothetical protein